MPTENAAGIPAGKRPGKTKWQPTELQPPSGRSRQAAAPVSQGVRLYGLLLSLLRLLRKAHTARAQKRCYFCCVRISCCSASRYQQQTKFLWENHIETMDELLAYKEKCRSPTNSLPASAKFCIAKREPNAAREKIKSLTQQMKSPARVLHLFRHRNRCCRGAGKTTASRTCRTGRTK